MIMQFSATDVRPTAVRESSKELSELELAVSQAFKQSIAEGAQERGTWLGKPMQAPVKDLDEWKDVRKAVQKVAGKEGMGFRVRLVNDEETEDLSVVFWAVEISEKLYAACPECGKTVAVSEDKKLRVHGPRDNRCSGSGIDVEVSDE